MARFLYSSNYDSKFHSRTLMGLQNHKNAYSCFKELKYSTIVSKMFCSFPVNVSMPLYDCFYDVLISADVVVAEPILGKDGH